MTTDFAIIDVSLCYSSHPSFLPNIPELLMARMTRFLLLITCLVGLTGADNWDRFRGPNGTGTVADKDVPVTFIIALQGIYPSRS